MTEGTLDARVTLDRVLEHLRDDKGAGELQAMLSTLRDSLGSDEDVEGRSRLIDEIRALSEFIDVARQDLAALRPRDIQERYIPTASDELDAIVQATETATHDIMDAVEGLEELGDALDPDQAEVLNQATMRIYEACTFQDITGQRITKVVKTLKTIEERVDALIATFGGVVEGGSDGAVSAEEWDRDRATVAATGDQDGDAALLNGPGMGGAAMNQDDIDALLKDFD